MSGWNTERVRKVVTEESNRPTVVLSKKREKWGARKLLAHLIDLNTQMVEHQEIRMGMRSGTKGTKGEGNGGGGVKGQVLRTRGEEKRSPKGLIRGCWNAKGLKNC
jgi:hypothetical protein